MKGNCLIAQSGGPTAVINHSLIGLIERAMQSPLVKEIFGAVNGIHGLLHNEYIHLNELSPHKLQQLKNTPGAALGTWRYKVNEQDVEKIVNWLIIREIRYFFYIGGNGSMQVASLIDEMAQRKGYCLTVIGVPKSIDNDLLHTDHSPGFGSAAKFLTTCTLDIAMDVKSNVKSNRVTIMETMGRNTGWLAAACALAREVNPDIPSLIYIPEQVFSLEKFVEDVVAVHAQQGFCLVVVSEGIRDEQGRLIAEESVKVDSLNRPQLGGVSVRLANVIEERTKLSARYILPSIWQRSSMTLSSKVDVEEAYMVGKKAVEFAEEGLSGKMVTIERCAGGEYKAGYHHVPLSWVANEEKKLPLHWYDPQTCGMTREFIQYVQPLIQGEVPVPMRNGLPTYHHLF